jgi:hypothetical protein
MFVRVYSVSVLSCVGSDIALGSSPVQGVLPTVCKIWKLSDMFRNENRPEGLISQREKMKIPSSGPL